MGGLCSRSSNTQKISSNVNPYAADNYKAVLVYQSNLQSTRTPPEVWDSVEKPLQEPKQLQEDIRVDEKGTTRYGTNLSPDDFYDGIPRFPTNLSLKSRSVRSTQAAVAKVSEVSSRLGRAGTLGLGKAVDVLDTFGSSMTNLNPTSGFVSGVSTKGHELSILSFEVANTIMKGSHLMQSLSKRSIRHLKEVVLPSEGVKNLVSTDIDELLKIVAADQREELKIFSGEVVRFGSRCKDPQWHNLDRYFEKIGRELNPQNYLKEEAESVIEELMTLVQYTAELYHELQLLDRLEQDYHHRLQEPDNSVATQKGDGLASFKAELKSRRKQVKSLKKKSLWCRSLEEVIEKLVDVVQFLLLQMHDTFDSVDGDIPMTESVQESQRLGPAGLSLHYANIIMQIDMLVARSSSMPPNSRDALYQNLPPSIKSALRSKLQSFHVKEELTVMEIKAEMEKTLQWLVPVATNTAKAHHGFGWVGEWANTGSQVNRSSAAGPSNVMRIETLHHADKVKTEAYVLELVLWLHHLVRQFMVGSKVGDKRSPLQKANQHPKLETVIAPLLTAEDVEMLREVGKKKRMPGISKSHDFNSEKTMLNKHDRLSKSSGGHSTSRASKDLLSVNALPFIRFGTGNDKALDVIDRIEVVR